MSDELTIGEFLENILPRLRRQTNFPNWPPDCFALCLSLLKRTGAYADLFTKWPPEEKRGLSNWIKNTRKLGKQWRQDWRAENIFHGLDVEWKLVCDQFKKPLCDLNRNRPLCQALMKLIAVADEASESVGAPLVDKSDQDDEFLMAASICLEPGGSLCKEIDRTRLTVLPRMHTPQNGLTERSLSLYLSLIDSFEVRPQWVTANFIQRDSFNLLLVPWPFEVLVRKFRDVTDVATVRLPDDLGFFTYDLIPDETLLATTEALYEEACRKLGRIDCLVLPEMAVSYSQFHSLRKRFQRDAIVICGVGKGEHAGQSGTNEVRL